MTLDEFIQQWGRWPNNAWVKYPGLKLYVRRGSVIIRTEGNSYICDPCLTIASVEAHVPGAGVFTRLIEELKLEPFGIYVENVHNLRLRRKLERMGFTKVNETHGPNYQLNCEQFIRDDSD